MAPRHLLLKTAAPIDALAPSLYGVAYTGDGAWKAQGGAGVKALHAGMSGAGAAAGSFLGEQGGGIVGQVAAIAALAIANAIQKGRGLGPVGAKAGLITRGLLDGVGAATGSHFGAITGAAAMRRAANAIAGGGTATASPLSLFRPKTEGTP